MSKLFNRRYFVKGIIGAGFSFLGLFYVGRSFVFGSKQKIDLRVDQLSQEFPKHESLLEIGKAYLKAHPKENDLHTLSGWVFTGNLPLRARIQKDFNSGNTVSVQGWELSRLEARACALWHVLSMKGLA